MIVYLLINVATIRDFYIPFNIEKLIFSLTTSLLNDILINILISLKYDNQSYFLFSIDITHIFYFFLFVTFYLSPVFGQEESNNNIILDDDVFCM